MSSPSSNNTPEPDVSGTSLPVAATQPDQAEFTHEERDFLCTHLPAYRAHCGKLDKVACSPRKVQGVKGDKKRWVLDVVYPEFSRKFSGSGSNAESLKQVIMAYFGDTTIIILSSRSSQNGFLSPELSTPSLFLAKIGPLIFGT